MPDERFVPKSVGKSIGALTLVGLLAGAGALFGSSCTDDSGNGKFVEPTHDSGAGGGSGGASPSDAATGGTGGSTGGAAGHPTGGAAGAATGGAAGA